jgi:hypothetical protein
MLELVCWQWWVVVGVQNYGDERIGKSAFPLEVSNDDAPAGLGLHM